MTEQEIEEKKKLIIDDALHVKAEAQKMAAICDQAIDALKNVKTLEDAKAFDEKHVHIFSDFKYIQRV